MRAAGVMLMGPILAGLVSCQSPQGGAPGAVGGDETPVPATAAEVGDAPDVGSPAAPRAARDDTTTQAPAPPPQPLTRLEPFPGVVVRIDRPAVELRATVCLEAGWLEQIACAPGSREHESLLVPQARPSQVHAALLMAGFEPGEPASWSYVDGRYAFTPPTGTRLDVRVRYTGEDGRPVDEPIRAWVRDHLRRREFPDDPWVFAGSRVRPNLQWMGEGEHYVADMTGSIIGLVTFGDEVIGFSRVWADKAAVQPPEWEVNTDRVPPVGTEVTLIIEPR